MSKPIGYTTKLKNRRVHVRLDLDQNAVIIESKKLIPTSEFDDYMNSKPADSFVKVVTESKSILNSHMAISLEGAYVVYATLHKLFANWQNEIENEFTQSQGKI